MRTLLDSYPVTDGYNLSTKFRCALRYRDLAVQQYEELRRSGAYRSKTWLAPKDSSVLIPARDSFEYQIYLLPGSAIWGYSFIAATGGQLGAGTLSFNVRDGCDDLALFSEVSTFQIQSNPYPQNYLAKLWIIGKPGILNVEICNTYGTAETAQLALYGGEPVP